MLQKWYRQFLKKHRLVIVMYGSTFMLSGLLAIGISYQLNQLVMENGKWMELGICLGLVVGYALCLYGKQRLKTELKAHCQTALLQEVFQASVWHGREAVEDRRNASDQLQTLLHQSEVLSTFYFQHFPSIIQSILLMSLILILLATEQGLLTVVLLGTVFGMLGLMKLMEKKIETLRQAYVVEEGRYFDFSQSFLENMESIQLGHRFAWVREKVRDRGYTVTCLGNQVTLMQGLESYAALFLRYLFIALFVLRNQNQWLLSISLLQLFFDALLQGKEGLLAYQTYRVAREVLETKLTWHHQEGKVILNAIHSLRCIDYQSDYAKAKPLTQDFETGKVYCLVGLNGIGKTTFFNTLLGFETEWSGKILFNGESLEKIRLSSLWNRCLFVMNQENDILEYIDVPSEQIEWSRGERQQYLLKALDPAMIHHALILLDEPSASLDATAKQALVEKLGLLANENIVLVITHDKALVQPAFVEVRMENV